MYTLLLEDILVLLQKQDERLILKCHSKNLAGTADTKHIFSPIIKLNTVLVRSVATGQLTPNRLICFSVLPFTNKAEQLGDKAGSDQIIQTKVCTELSLISARTFSPARQQVLLRPIYVGQWSPDLRADGTHGLRSENVSPLTPD